ncbi:MAG: cation:proton antiporter, partial [Mariprofundaceae bacterium]|nr:cation:proton antiporter [Mariprofundaceae bacterium]
MDTGGILFEIFLIFFGAAVFATIALYARQALMVGYIVLGVLLGPVFELISDPYTIKQIADIGIMFLLFLLGLNLPAQKLLQMMRESMLVTMVSTLLFVIAGGGVAWMFGYSALESVLIGACLVFSSTIIGLKLLPTTVLHHKRTGEIIISVLLLQDILAILLMLSLQVMGKGQASWGGASITVIAFPMLVLLAYVIEYWLLVPLMRRFDKIQEYIFLLAIGWCLGMAELARVAGLPAEIGAFIAGVSLANNPVSLFISESLKPLRDFFLIIFFFSIGAGFALQAMQQVLMPALILAALTLVLKPWIYRLLLLQSGETKKRAGETGVRLGQSSEFSL